MTPQEIADVTVISAFILAVAGVLTGILTRDK
jgi:hypothetical protein